ncbi:hypothetical protein QX776_07355 [Alteromonadaceae bacterium BrNp21-10]|nr:hypothetical protein [Alteromonadaceae bacterium BrNp21-10]
MKTLQKMLINYLQLNISDLIFRTIDSEADFELNIDIDKDNEYCATAKFCTLEEEPQTCSMSILVKERIEDKYQCSVTEIDSDGNESAHSKHISMGNELADALLKYNRLCTQMEEVRAKENTFWCQNTGSLDFNEVTSQLNQYNTLRYERLETCKIIQTVLSDPEREYLLIPTMHNDTEWSLEDEASLGC